MLVTTDYWENRFFNDFLQSIKESRLRYYASDIFNPAEEEERKLYRAIRRAMNVCETLNLPLNENFKPVYRVVGHDIYKDWKLSPLGYYLVMINGDATNPKVAEAQIQILIHQQKS